MPYKQKNSLGATAMSSSAPYVIATDQVWPIPVFPNVPINGTATFILAATGATGPLTPNIAGATVVPSVGAGQYLYITSIQFGNLHSTYSNNVTLYFGSPGNPTTTIVSMSVAANSSTQINWPAPLRYNIANGYVYFTQVASSTYPGFFIVVQGYKSTV